MSQQNEVILRYWPHPKQQVFHRDRYKIRYRSVFAGTGTGKTYALCFEILSMLLENPGAVAYIFEPTYKMVRRILIPALESKWLLGKPFESNPLVAFYNRGDNYINLHGCNPNNSEEAEGTLWFGSLEEPEYAEGPNIDIIGVDEAQYIRRFTESWDVILRRLRGSGQIKRDISCAVVTTTPPPLLPGDRLHEFFEDPKTRNPLSKVYRWHLDDNPYTTEQYKAEIKASHHGSLAKRFIEGLFAPAGVGSFDFDSTVHEVKQVEKQTVKLVVYGVDFGWTNPSAIIAVGFDSDDRTYILDEFYQNRTQTETLIQELKEMQAQYGEGPVVCDSSEPQTIDMLCKAGLVAQGNTSKREDGIHELGGRFHVQGDGKPRIFVSSKCVKWISEVMVYNAEVKENDHAIDATRYAIMSRAGVSGLDVSFSKVRL